MHYTDIDTSIELPVMEHFFTIQGEGFHAGRAAYFIRLAGCDVGCVWCDVKESWGVEGHPIFIGIVFLLKSSRLHVKKHMNERTN